MREKSEDQIIRTEYSEVMQKSYIDYAMSVIMSRAIPEIDGFKPSHRKLLYTMYKMGLLSGARTKSANIVGQTMRLNPHGDAAIYETMVRLSKGYDALLTPFVDSKGNFGKVYSREQLLDLVWGYDYQGDIRTVDVHIRRLREKLERNPAAPEYIITKWGVGYYFAEA